jgi:hypothetical protein
VGQVSCINEIGGALAGGSELSEIQREGFMSCIEESRPPYKADYMLLSSLSRGSAGPRPSNRGLFLHPFSPGKDLAIPSHKRARLCALQRCKHAGDALLGLQRRHLAAHVLRRTEKISLSCSQGGGEGSVERKDAERGRRTVFTHPGCMRTRSMPRGASSRLSFAPIMLRAVC